MDRTEPTDADEDGGPDDMGSYPIEMLRDCVLSEPDGTPISYEELLRSLDEAEEELRRDGPVPAEEVARRLNAIFDDHEQHNESLPG